MVGIAVLLLGAMLFVPVSLSNILPALVIMLIAFAYLEEDGLLLCLALLSALALLTATSVAVWKTAGVVSEIRF